MFRLSATARVFIMITACSREATTVHIFPMYWEKTIHCTSVVTVIVLEFNVLHNYVSVHFCDAPMHVLVADRSS